MKILLEWRRVRWHIRWALVKKPWRHTYHGGITIHLPHSGSSALLYYHGHSEPDVCALIARVLRPGGVFFDVGSHIGEHTLVAASIVGDTGEVHAFEPNPVLLEVCRTSVEANGLQNVFLNPWAVSNGESLQWLRVMTDPSYSHLGHVIAERKLGRKSREEMAVRVRTISLDRYWNRDRPVHMVKIDVEGAEMRVLQGGRALLERQPGEAPVVVFEYHPETYERFGIELSHVVGLLEACGYTIWKLTGGGNLEPLRLAWIAGAISLVATKGGR